MIKNDEEKLFVVLEKLKDGVLESLRSIKNDFSTSDIDSVAAICTALQEPNQIISFLRLIQTENIFTTYGPGAKGPQIPGLIETCINQFNDLLKSFSKEVSIAVRTSFDFSFYDDLNLRLVKEKIQGDSDDLVKMQKMLSLVKMNLKVKEEIKSLFPLRRSF